jgi:hypothetical protein
MGSAHGNLSLRFSIYDARRAKAGAAQTLKQRRARARFEGVCAARNPDITTLSFTLVRAADQATCFLGQDRILLIYWVVLRGVADRPVALAGL